MTEPVINYKYSLSPHFAICDLVMSCGVEKLDAQLVMLISGPKTNMISKYLTHTA